jgi:hypothetical protein
MPGPKLKSPPAKNVTLVEYKYFGSDTGVHNSLKVLINSNIVTRKLRTANVSGDRCTVIITVPKRWGGSFSGEPGHCGVVLWNSGNFDYQSFGIMSDGSFADEEVNVHKDKIKIDANFKIWYCTKFIDSSTYNKLQGRMVALGGEKVTYGKFFVARGRKADSSYSCVTAVDTILCAGGLAWAIASLSSTPYAYAQTFSRAAWYISYADNVKHT